ncbi:MAG: exodeoxyribonuclease VII large subunit, partial [Actinomycetota bacterium]
FHEFFDRELGRTHARIAPRDEERRALHLDREDIHVDRIGVDLVERFDKRLASRARILSDRTSSAVLRSRSRLGRCAERLRTRPATIIAASRHRLDVQRATVRLLDPATTLARGWSITRDADGRVVKSVNDAPKGATLVTTVADGTITSTVEEVT